MSDLPPSKTVLDDDLVQKFDAMVKNPDDNKNDPKGLRCLVAVFWDEQPRFYPAPGFQIQDKGPSEFQTPEPATQLIRSDAVQSVVFDTDAGRAVWYYVNGVYYRG